ncbi:MAG: hypothetical protein ACI4VN_00300 [Clostridia bacterium]
MISKNIEIENEIYTLITKYEHTFNNQKVFYFYSAILDRNVFFIDKNNELEEITDINEVTQIEEELDLQKRKILFEQYTPMSIIKRMKGLRKLPDNEKKKYLDEQFYFLQKMNIPGVDYTKLRSRIYSTGNVYEAESIAGASGLYTNFSNNIYLEKQQKRKKTGLHEAIHKATGLIGILTTPIGFLEGATESLAQKAYPLQKQNSSLYVYDTRTSTQDSKKVKKIIYSNNGGYPESVSLIRQIEVATGMTADKDILEGKRTILKDFKRKYGAETLNEVIFAASYAARYRSNNFMYDLTEFYSPEEVFRIYQEAQNKLLENVFDKDYPKHITIETAKVYLDKMKKMEYARGRIEGDNFFQDYYTNKYNMLRQELIKQGISEELIDENISEYTPVKFQGLETDSIIDYNVSEIAYMLKSRGITQIDENTVKSYIVTIDGQEHRALAVNGEIIKYTEEKNSPGFNMSRRIGKYKPEDGETQSQIYSITTYKVSDAEVTEVKKIGINKETENLEIRNAKGELLGEDYPKKIYGILDPLNQEFVSSVNDILADREIVEGTGAKQLRQLAETQEARSIWVYRRNFMQKIQDWFDKKLGINKEESNRDGENR